MDPLTPFLLTHYLECFYLAENSENNRRLICTVKIKCVYLYHQGKGIDPYP